jgi:predicted HAD superfamily Cof-like phosphohydrolase
MATEIFCLVITGDAPCCKIVYGRQELRKQFDTEFFGEHPAPSANAAESDDRWQCFEKDAAEATGKEVLLYVEGGEDYFLKVFKVTEGGDPLSDVDQFHDKYGHDYSGLPRVLPVDLADFRRRFMREELLEYEEHDDSAQRALSQDSLLDQADIAHHLEEMLDALLDLTYVVCGTAILHGFGNIFREGWRRVHTANMTKIKAVTKEQSTRQSLHDVVKPPNFVPPSHIDLVENNLHRSAPKGD